MKWFNTTNIKINEDLHFHIDYFMTITGGMFYMAAVWYNHTTYLVDGGAL